MNWQVKIAPSLGGGFAGVPASAWGTVDYTNQEDPTCFFGLYGLPDFYTLWRHAGEKHILWAGSDIRHFINGYWLDEKGTIKISPKPLAVWIQKNCESYVENQVEYEALKKWGIESKIVPSFLGNTDDFTPQEISPEKRYYSSVSGNDFLLYGWDKINKIAEQNPDTKYYLYGNTVPWEAPPNVIVRSRVSQEEMNEEAKSMTGAIRMTEFEGCSELIVKSVLWGQKPISLIEYPFLEAENPREELLKIINRYPWNLHKLKCNNKKYTKTIKYGK
mgnify:CR=1 FL=1